MEKQDEGPPAGLEPRLEHMDREAIDVVDNAGADAGWQRDSRNRQSPQWRLSNKSPTDHAVPAKPCSFDRPHERRKSRY